MQRIKWIDVAKGWGIILLIYGHISNDIFAKWLYTFHIPLFFFLSGYVFNPNKTFNVLIKSKAKSLLLPYISLGIPLLLINLRYGYKLPFLLQKFIIQERMFPLWFITALFLQIFICYFIINKLKRIWHFPTIILLSLAGIIFWRLGGNALPWNLDISLVSLPFFYGGLYLRNYPLFQQLFDNKKFLPLFTVFLTANILGGLIIYKLLDLDIDLFANNFGFEPLSYFTAFMGIFATILFFNKYNSNILSYIGKNTLVYFAWQQDIAIILAKKVMTIFSINYNHQCIVNVFVLSLSLLILTVINLIISKTKLKIFIGK